MLILGQSIFYFFKQIFNDFLATLEISAGHWSLTGKFFGLSGKYRRLPDMYDR